LPMPETRRRLAGSLIVLLAATCFGTLGPLSRFAYDAGIQPIGFVAWRAAIGGTVLGLLLLARIALRRERWVPFGSLSRATFANLALATLTGVTLNLAIFIAFGRITIALALLGFYTYPVMTAVVDAVIRRERVGRATVAALALAVGGMALVVAGQIDPSGGIRFDLLGFGLALSAAVSQTIFVSVSRTGYRAVPTHQAMTTILLGNAIGFFVVALLSGEPAQLAAPLLHPSALGLLIAAGVAGAGVPSLLFLTGVRWIGGVRTGILALFEPVVGVLIAAAVLGESVGPIQVLGGALVLGAALVLQLAPAPTPETPEGVPPEAVPGTI
jgi:drug/metabolite transporter, DME family